jgi:putative transposase
MIYSKQHPEFVTITCLDWQPILKEDRFKDVIIESLIFLTNAQRVIIYGFVILSNHFYLIRIAIGRQMIGDHQRDDLQRDFLKYTGQQILSF